MLIEMNFKLQSPLTWVIVVPCIGTFVRALVAGTKIESVS